MSKNRSKNQVVQGMGFAVLAILLVAIFSTNNGAKDVDLSSQPTQLEATAITPYIDEPGLPLGYSSEPPHEEEAKAQVLGVSDVNNLQAEPTNTVTESAGTIHEYASQTLIAGIYYSWPVDSPIALSWAGEEILYTFAKDTSNTNLTFLPLIPDGEGEQDDVIKVSPLLFPQEGEVFLILYAPSGAQPISITAIQPTPDTEYSFKPAVASSTGGFNLDSGAKYTTLNIVSRDQWGANTSFWDGNSSTDIDDPARFNWMPYHYGVNRFVIHHTAGYDQYSGSEATRLVYMLHAYTRNWGDIGYNYIIDKDGNIFEGKGGGDGVFGYHASREANQMSIGIALIGNFTSSNPTPAALSSLKSLLAEKAVLFGIPKLTYSYGSYGSWLNSGYTVFGHRGSYHYHAAAEGAHMTGWDVNATACPGNTFVNYLPTLVAQAESVRANPAYLGQLRKVSDHVERALDRFPAKDNKIYVVFDLPESASQAEVLAKIPPYASITSTVVVNNTATLTVSDWNNGGTSPPVGWMGNPTTGGVSDPGLIGTYFPPSLGPAQRIGTLLKIFRLRSDVITASRDLTGFTIDPIAP